MAFQSQTYSDNNFEGGDKSVMSNKPPPAGNENHRREMNELKATLDQVYREKDALDREV